MTEIYAIIPPKDEKGPAFSEKGYFQIQAISKILPKYSTVISGDDRTQKSILLALKITPDDHIGLLGKPIVEEDQALAFLDTFENNTLLITSRTFLAALNFRDIGEKTMLVKIIVNDVWNDIEEIA